MGYFRPAVITAEKGVYMIRTMTSSIFQNMGDAIATIVAWVVYIAIRLLKGLSEEVLEDLPIIGHWLSRKSCQLLGWLDGHCFDLALALTLGLVANLIWDVVAAILYWQEPDKSKATVVPAPGPLNWVVTGVSFLLLTILRSIGCSIGEFLYWSTWWQIALAILLTILGVAAVVVIVALILRWRGLGGRRRRRRRR